MKSTACVFVVLVFVAAVLGGCGGSDDGHVTLLDFSKMDGTWGGTWHNATYDSSGAANLAITVDSEAKTAQVVLTLGGNVFGGATPPPITVNATYTDTTLTFSPQAGALGTINASISADGTVAASITSVPGGVVSAVYVTGTATDHTLTLNYTAHLVAGGDATGTLTLTQL